MVEGNLFVSPAGAPAGETFDALLCGGSFRVERIVSTGHSTPPGEWLDQPESEWVVLLSGAARLRFADEPAERALSPGDYLHIAPRRRHRVEWTQPVQPTIWLAIHYAAEHGQSPGSSRYV